MKTSLIIISSLLTLSVFLPFLLFVYNGTKNTASTKKQVNALIKDNGIIYSIKDIWRNCFIGISSNNKTITYIHFKLDTPTATHIALTDIKQCHIVKAYNKGTDKAVSLKSLDLEFVSKTSGNPIFLSIFSISTTI